MGKRKKNNKPIKLDFDSVYGAHHSQGAYVEDHVADELMEQIINTMCGDMTCVNANDNGSRQLANYSIEYLVDNLPAVNFVVAFYTQLIIGSGLQAKDATNQSRLDAWLAQKNNMGQTNQDIIADSVKNSLMYGYSGIRLSMNNFYPVLPNQFRIWKLPMTETDENGRTHVIPGLRSLAFYEVNLSNDFKVEKDDKENVFIVGDRRYSLDEVIREKMMKRAYDGSYIISSGNDDEDFARAKTVYVEPDNFCHLRNSDDGDYGRSPLSYDKLRTSLLVDLLRNFRDEILNDGSDYIMYLKAGLSAGQSLTGLLSEQTTNQSIKGSMDKRMVKTAADKQMEAAKSLATKMKKSAKTRMSIVRKDQIDEITKLEGTVRLPDYISIYSNAKDVVADIYGIHSLLVGGRSSGWNTGMSSMLEFTMDKTIRPFQQRYSHQLSDYICRAAGVNGGVKFREYELLDKKAIADIDKVRADTEAQIANAAKVQKETKLMKASTVNNTQNQNPNQNQNKQNQNKSATK